VHASDFPLQDVVDQSLLLHLAQAVESFADDIDVEK